MFRILCNLVLVTVTAEKIDMLEMEAGFLVLNEDLGTSRFDFYPECCEF